MKLQGVIFDLDGVITDTAHSATRGQRGRL